MVMSSVNGPGAFHTGSWESLGVMEATWGLRISILLALGTGLEDRERVEGFMVEG